MVNIEKLEIEATARILKYAEGANPEKDAPIEIEEKKYIFKGHEAKRVLEEQGIDVQEAIKLGLAHQK